MEATLAIVLTSIAVATIVISISSKKGLTPSLIGIGLIGLYMSAIQIHVQSFVVFLSFSLAFIASGVIIIIANAKFKRAYK